MAKKNLLMAEIAPKNSTAGVLLDVGTAAVAGAATYGGIKFAEWIGGKIKAKKAKKKLEIKAPQINNLRLEDLTEEEKNNIIRLTSQILKERGVDLDEGD